MIVVHNMVILYNDRYNGDFLNGTTQGFIIEELKKQTAILRALFK